MKRTLSRIHRHAVGRMSESKQSLILGACFMTVFMGGLYYFGHKAQVVEKQVASAPEVVPVSVKKVWLDDPKKMPRAGGIGRQ